MPISSRIRRNKELDLDNFKKVRKVEKCKLKQIFAIYCCRTWKCCTSSTDLFMKGVFF